MAPCSRIWQSPRSAMPWQTRRRQIHYEVRITLKIYHASEIPICRYPTSTGTSRSTSHLFCIRTVAISLTSPPKKDDHESSSRRLSKLVAVVRTIQWKQGVQCDAVSEDMTKLITPNLPASTKEKGKRREKRKKDGPQGIHHMHRSAMIQLLEFPAPFLGQGHHFLHLDLEFVPGRGALWLRRRVIQPHL